MKPLLDLLKSGKLITWALNSHTSSENIGTEVINNTNKFICLGQGMILIEPKADVSASLCISCGIHGNETAPIELVEQVFQQLVRAEICLNCRLLIIVGNQPAMRANARFCDENLNRLFKRPQATHVNTETNRAQDIMAVVDTFFDGGKDHLKVHLDLHTAIRGSVYEKFAIYPFQKSGEWKTEPMTWLANAGIEAILLANKTSGTFSCYTDHYHQAVAFTVELGKARAFGENDHQTLIQFKAALTDLLNNPELIINNDYGCTSNVFNVVTEVMRHSESDFELNLTDDFSNFSSLPAGYQLTEDGLNSYFISGSDKAVVFPNKNVPKGQRVALVIEPYA